MDFLSRINQGGDIKIKISQLPQKLMIPLEYFINWHAQYTDEEINACENPVPQIMRELYIATIFGLGLRKALFRAFSKSGLTTSSYENFCNQNPVYLSSINSNYPDAMIQFDWGEPELKQYMSPGDLPSKDTPFTDEFKLEITEYSSYSFNIQEVIGKKLKKDYDITDTIIVCYTELNDIGDLNTISQFLVKNNATKLSVTILQKITITKYRIFGFCESGKIFSDMCFDVTKEKSRGKYGFLVNSGQSFTKPRVDEIDTRIELELK